MARETKGDARPPFDSSADRGVFRLLRDGEFDIAASEIRRILQRTAEMLRGSNLDVLPLTPGETPLGTYDIPDGHHEIDRYWVNAPFAYVVITYDTDATAHQYHTVEPDLDEFEASLLERIRTDIRDPLLYRQNADPTSEKALIEELQSLLEQYGLELGMDSFYTLLYYLRRDFHGYGPLDPLMDDPHIEDISCDGYDLPIFVYHDEYTDIGTNIAFRKEELDNFVIRLAQRSGQHISVGDPVLGTTLPNGARAELALGEEVTPRGSAFTIRLYAEEPFTPIDLVKYGTFSIEQMAYLWLCIEHNKSLIFAGGTASGKTTSMNAVSMFVPPRSKVLSIEDTRELALYHDNWLSSVTRERLHQGSDITMYDLLRSALRHRPEYIIVGEVRGKEAVTLFQAMNTGHTTFSTMHADSIETVINRLENEPINVPRAMVQSLDLLCVQTLTRHEGERVRRSQAIGEIGAIDQRTGELDYSSAFSWDPEDDTFDRNDSSLLDEIQRENGWSRTELRRELRNREEFLQYLLDKEVSDYRRFTALINEYYADADDVMARVEADENVVDTSSGA
ncbi:type II secretion system protein [Haloferax mediterranei ATCC 33500]|uniref:Type II secretion system protein n=1 Tax=Haloferax mediterranei (strain ATCC 33500 / DSM 1411 / JCM 8866 / NBRC 14739 / NCIMB 2177 / R-4) TaxID=523841 RepID=I3R3D8_HALMT|nr:type II/IV secretion system ATPase subunit [Haloferax mediterranei]AFK18748.1 type II secretion system protein [Haloferax mediterranei ATCC 33500]AHZ21884.1 type II secretion system protein [Haloferax mediterranei ATCC 33500]EMA03392.1 type II secretion system protein [Haloferax mediterranei ATCC 33500]MDX5988844.1 type II/IV secretion system ATPase subunit [Haloferax mediterranei ATCC 33500]QCQ75245.1 type II secretion system protein [Haloferax mediterranei ATCC 33500]